MIVGLLLVLVDALSLKIAIVGFNKSCLAFLSYLAEQFFHFSHFVLESLKVGSVNSCRAGRWGALYGGGKNCISAVLEKRFVLPLD